jgi:hypothetical protein
MEVIGKLKVKGEIQTFGSNGFQKRDIVITTDEQYPQQIAIELHQDKCDLINPYDVGHNIKTSINLRGREWINPQGEAKYFNSLVGWRIEKVEDAPSVDLPPVEQYKEDNNEPDDLPF